MKGSSSKSINYTLMIVYINVALYATCFQIQRPLEPFMVEKLNITGDSAGEYARLQSFFSIMQTIGSFLTGRFLDKFGAKGGFIISFLASAAGYALLSQATNLNILYMSKIPTIFQAGFLCAQTAASQATGDGAERVQALGRLTMSYTIGSVLGPLLGGFMGASGDYYLGAKLAVVGSLLSVALTLLMPNEGAKVEHIDEHDAATTTLSDGSSMKIQSPAWPAEEIASKAAAAAGKVDIPSTYKVIAAVWLFLAAKVITSVANAMAAAAFPLILKNTYGMDEQALGLSMSFMSACNAVVNGLFLGPIAALAGGDLITVISFCLVAMGLLSVLQAVFAGFEAMDISRILPVDSATAGMYEFLFISFVLSMFQYVLSTTITGESTARVGPHAKGTLLGLEHSLFALARVGAPQLGVWLLAKGGVATVASCCAAVFFGVWAMWIAFCGRFGKLQQGVEERKEK